MQVLIAHQVQSLAKTLELINLVSSIHTISGQALDYEFFCAVN